MKMKKLNLFTVDKERKNLEKNKKNKNGVFYPFYSLKKPKVRTKPNKEK